MWSGKVKKKKQKSIIAVNPASASLSVQGRKMPVIKDIKIL